MFFWFGFDVQAKRALKVKMQQMKSNRCDGIN